MPRISPSNLKKRDAAALRGISRAVAVLRALNESSRASVLQINRVTKISRPSLYRIFESLEREGLVVREAARGPYRLTARVRELSVGYRDQDEIAEAAEPILSELQRKIVWPIDLATYDNGTMLLRDTTRGSSPLVFDRAAVGWRLPVLHTSLGLAYVAYLDEAAFKGVLRKLRKSSDPLDALAHEPGEVARLIKQTLRDGYATRHSGFHPKTNSIAVPIHGRTTPVGAIGLTFVASAMTAQEAARSYLASLVSAAEAIVERLHKAA